MKKTFVFYLLFALSGMMSLYAEEISFTASATPSTVVVGQQFKLSYTANSLEVKEFRIPDIEGFDVLMGPTTSTYTSYNIVNGKRSQSISMTYYYVLMANKEGEYTLPAASAKIKGNSYTSNTVKVKVLPQDRQTGSAQTSEEEGGRSSVAETSSQQIFMRAILSSDNVYEQQPLLVTYKLYTRMDISGLNSAKFPEFDGFLSQEIEQPENKEFALENYKGLNYRTVVLKQTLLFPQRSGKLKIESGEFDLSVRVRMQQTARSIFDDFFDSYTDVNKKVTTPAVTVNVKPLPNGKPASFTGTVGDLKLTSSINTTTLKTNESVTLKLELSGSGNLKLIKAPEVAFPADFDVYDPKVESNFKTTTSTVTGKQTIEYLAIPRHAGEFEIPPVEFSYFDLNSGSYKTLKTEAYTIKVEPGEEVSGTTGTVISNYTNKEDVKYLGKDIRYVRTGRIVLKQRNDIFFGTFGYWLFYLIPTLLLIVCMIVYRKQAKENANITLLRTKKANKVAVKRLKQAEKYMRNDQKEAFYEELMRALWGYVSDKLNMPLSVLTKENIGVELTGFGADKDFVDEFINILNTCEFARYAPGMDEGNMEKLYDRAGAMINKMETIIKKTVK